MTASRRLVAWPLLPFVLLLGGTIIAPASSAFAIFFVLFFAFPGAALWCFLGLILALRARPVDRVAIGANALFGVFAAAPFFFNLSGIWHFHI